MKKLVIIVIVILFYRVDVNSSIFNVSILMSDSVVCQNNSVLAKSGIQISGLFDNHMVLQRNTKINIRGFAEPNQELKLCFNGQRKLVKTELSGHWQLQLDKMHAGGPYDMKIYCNADSVIFTDVLVGDVYLAGGQSNMAFTVSELKSNDREELLTDCNYPQIRYYDVAKVVKGGVLLNTTDRSWTQCNASNVKEWSAVATYFARQVHHTERVPIGIINCNQGGSTAEAWISPEAFSADTTLNKAKISPYTNILKYYCNPSTLYESMLKKLIGYRLNGCIWYQGEANTGFADKYKIVFESLIKDWRRLWDDKDLPFIFAQLSSYKPTNNPNGDNWAVLREAQYQTWRSTKKTAMIVTADVGDTTDIHPKNKKTVGLRFALAAEKLIYNRNVEASGPIYKKAHFFNSYVIVTFKNVKNGFNSINDSIAGFEIAGRDMHYWPAKAIVNKNRIKVWADAVENPIAVRYLWINGLSYFLYNSGNLPTAPFMIEKNGNY